MPIVSDKFIPRDTSRRKRLHPFVFVVSTRRGQVTITRGFFSNYLALILGPTGGRDLALTPINPAAAAVVYVYIDETFLSDHQFF